MEAIIADAEDNIITWYAFECPKTRREYFVEPNSGATTWSIPMSRSTSSQFKSPVKSIGHQTSTPQTSSLLEQKSMSQNTVQPSKWGFVIAITVAVSLICNTVFLVLLIKMTAHNPTLPVNTILEASPQPPLSEQTNTNSTEFVPLDLLVDKNKVIVEEGNKEIVVDVSFNENAKDEVPIQEQVTSHTVIQEIKEVPHTTQKQKDKQSYYGENLNKEQDAHRIEVDEDAQKEKQSVPKQTIPQSKDEKMTKSMREEQKKRNTGIPAHCWVPFAYVFDRHCGGKDKATGLHKPLFDTEQFVREMI
jgi:hypothetical protein